MHNARFELETEESADFMGKMIQFLRNINEHADLDDQPSVAQQIKKLEEVGLCKENFVYQYVAGYIRTLQLQAWNVNGQQFLLDEEEVWRMMKAQKDIEEVRTGACVGLWFQVTLLSFAGCQESHGDISGTAR